EQRRAEQRVDGWGDGGDDHGVELRRGSDGDARGCGGDQRGSGKRNADHRHDAGGECGRGHRDGDEPGCTEREFGERVLLCRVADGERCGAEQRTGGGWDGGDDHGGKLRRGSDRDVRRYGGNQRGGGKRDADHGEDTGGECGRGHRDGDGERAEWELDEWVHLRCTADG